MHDFDEHLHLHLRSEYDVEVHHWPPMTIRWNLDYGKGVATNIDDDDDLKTNITITEQTDGKH